MAPIITSAEISRPPAEVFPYVINPSSFTEWQHGVVSGHMDGPATRVGSRCTTVRKIGGREREVNTRITEYDPPRRWADCGIDGPIRAIVIVTVEPLEDGSRSRLTISVDFTGARDRQTAGSARGASPGSRRNAGEHGATQATARGRPIVACRSTRPRCATVNSGGGRRSRPTR